MLSPYIHAALAQERHQEFLARAETDRQARQARLHRLRDGAGSARRSPRRWRPAWLRPGRSRLFGHRPRSAVTGRPVVLRDGSTVLIRPFGELDGRASQRARHLLAWCEQAGFEAELSASIKAVLWAKLAFICAQAGMTAAVRPPIGEICTADVAWAAFNRMVGSCSSSLPLRRTGGLRATATDARRGEQRPVG